jgi:hypothetical protein
MIDETLLLKMDGFNDAILGVGMRFGNEFMVYDYDKVIAILMNDESMTEEDAIDYWTFNMVGSWVGEETPAFLKRNNINND